MEKINIQQDHWIRDINDDDLINLKGCVLIYPYHYTFDDGRERNYVKFYWDGDTCHEIEFDEEKTMRNFYEHLKILLKVDVIDSTQPPLKIE